MNYFLSSTFYGTLKVSSITLPLLNTNIFSGFFDCDATSRFREDALFDKKVLLKENNTQVDVLQEINQLKSNLTTNNSTTEFTNDVTFQEDILLFNSSYLDETQTIITPPPTSLRQRLYDINSQLGDVSQEVSNALLETENLSTFISTIDKTYVGLSQVDNTSDLNKPISLATETALNQKVDSSTLTTLLSTKADLTDLQQINKTSLGLGNVDNTSDLNKPLSLASQQALDLKADANSVLSLTGDQTASGLKTFSQSVDVSVKLTAGGIRFRRNEWLYNTVTTNSITLPGSSSYIFWDLRGQTNVSTATINLNSLGSNIDRVGLVIKIYVFRNFNTTGNVAFTIVPSGSVLWSQSERAGTGYTNSSGTYGAVRIFEFVYLDVDRVLMINIQN